MSKIYEALKKAQREGRWHDDPGQTPGAAGDARLQPLDNASAAPAANVPERPDEPTETIEHRGPGEQEETSSVSSSLEPPKQGSQGPAANGEAANGAFTTHDLNFPAEPVSSKNGRRWRFWSHEPQSLTRDPRLILNQESLARAAEQFQVLRTSLEAWASERDQRVILITSALPGEGKSFVAVNLAVALSRAGSDVLLIDTDLRAPSLHLPFNLVPLSGLLPYLEGKAEFAESITATPEPRLGLIAAGGVTLSAPEVLAGSRMRMLIDCARQLQPPHIILLDAPAVVAGAETQILSNLVDGILLVVAANMTPRALVNRTLELIKGVPVLSAVLNRFEYSYSASRHLYHDRRYKPAADA
jgi:capsular exopolysaccharide synthesis family protein